MARGLAHLASPEKKCRRTAEGLQRMSLKKIKKILRTEKLSDVF
jgi:hypothetical protein